jgi:hypothetical protein
MATHDRIYYGADQKESYARQAFEIDLLKLVIALIAELVIFALWFDGPARERYEILMHVALPVFILLPIVNYRYLILVPFIAFLPDVARAMGYEIAHELLVLPLVFAAAFAVFIRRPKTALVAGYAAAAVWASHLIIDARKYTPVQNVGGYLWSDLILYALALTVIGFLLVQFLGPRETRTRRERL